MAPTRTKSGCFVPDERCLGGLLEINETYKNMMRTIGGDVSRAPPQKQQSIKNKQSSSSTPDAATLSRNRALKRAETNVGAQEHAKNLQHLNRRLAEQGLPSTPGLGEASRSASRSVSRCVSRCNSRPSSARSQAGHQQEDFKPWAPKKEHPLIRAVTVPNVLSLHSAPSTPKGGHSSVPQSPDWQALKQRKHPVLDPPVQPVELPLEPATGLTPLLPSVLYKLYHEALMADILERHLWKEAHIQELCRQYVEVNPLDHRDVIEEVIQDIKATLDVR